MMGFFFFPTILESILEDLKRLSETFRKGGK